MLNNKIRECVRMLVGGECSNCYIIEKEWEIITSFKNEEGWDVLVYFWKEEDGFIDYKVKNDDPFLFFEIIKTLEK